LGVEDVTSPEFEAAIEMTREALVHLALPADEIQRVTTTMRRERYRSS
jgi:K+:H+ antiporter